jgi:energy-coupling factor transporter ATP-binding protein EcfA2
VSFVLDWQKKLGYKQDPFVAQPSKNVGDYIVGREKERENLNLFIIKQEKFGILHGPKGSGKTTLLLWLERQLKAHFLKVSVLLLRGKDVSTKKHFFERLLNESLSLLEQNVTKPHDQLKQNELEAFVLDRLAKKRLVILIDDASELHKENKALLRELLENGQQVQVLFVLERILKEHEAYGTDKLNLELKDMPIETLKELLKTRIGFVNGVETFPFEQQHLKELIESSKKNPVKLLELARTRAIELSLKVEGPPKVEKEPLSKRFDFFKKITPEKKKIVSEKKNAEPAPHPSKKETKGTETRQEGVTQKPSSQQANTPTAIGKDQQNNHQQKKSWFRIKLVDKREEAEVPKHVKKEELLDEELAKPREEKIDTELLQEIVEVGEKGASKEQHVKPVKKENTSEVEDMIQSLVDEMDEKK